MRRTFAAFVFVAASVTLGVDPGLVGAANVGSQLPSAQAATGPTETSLTFIFSSNGPMVQPRDVASQPADLGYLPVLYAAHCKDTPNRPLPTPQSSQPVEVFWPIVYTSQCTDVYIPRPTSTFSTLPTTQPQVNSQPTSNAIPVEAQVQKLQSLSRAVSQKAQSATPDIVIRVATKLVRNSVIGAMKVQGQTADSVKVTAENDLHLFLKQTEQAVNNIAMRIVDTVVTKYSLGS